MEALWTNPGLVIIAIKITSYLDINSICNLNLSCVSWCQIISNSIGFYQKILKEKLLSHQDKKWLQCHPEWQVVIQELSQSKNISNMILMAKNLHKMSNIVKKKSTEYLYTMTPLHLAVENSDEEFFEFILPLLNDKNPKAASGMTPLHYACKNGHLEFCQRLFETLENRNPVTKSNTTPLHLAAKFGHSTIIEYLLEDSESSINMQDIDGLTPLHMAVKFGHQKGKTFWILIAIYFKIYCAVYQTYIQTIFSTLPSLT